MKYVKTIIVEATPMTYGEYISTQDFPTRAPPAYSMQGYRIEYDNGTVTWEPKRRFEEAYRPMNLEN